MDDEKSGASVLGKMHSDSILIYLGQKDVVNDIKYAQEYQPRTTKEIRRSSIKAELVCRNIISCDATTSEQNTDTSIINEILVTVSDISLDFEGEKSEEIGGLLRQDSQVTLDLDEKRGGSFADDCDADKKSLLSMCWEGCFGR